VFAGPPLSKRTGAPVTDAAGIANSGNGCAALMDHGPSDAQRKIQRRIGVED
jgi:hypothetical protein